MNNQKILSEAISSMQYSHQQNESKGLEMENYEQFNLLRQFRQTNLNSLFFLYTNAKKKKTLNYRNSLSTHLHN